jgi:hypothetical protein
MCTTRRYIFSCSHPATHRFRNSLCSDPGARGCQVMDYNILLKYPCPKCKQRGFASDHDGWTPPKDNGDTWYIPSRCFVNVGFRTLNPFEEKAVNEEEGGDDESTPRTSTASTLRPSMEEEDLAPDERPSNWPMETAREKDTKTLRNLLKRMTVRKPSPCCVTEARQGAIEVCRIESRHQRIRGQIPARCASPV